MLEWFLTFQERCCVVFGTKGAFATTFTVTLKPTADFGFIKTHTLSLDFLILIVQANTYSCP